MDAPGGSLGHPLSAANGKGDAQGTNEDSEATYNDLFAWTYGTEKWSQVPFALCISTTRLRPFRRDPDGGLRAVG